MIASERHFECEGTLALAHALVDATAGIEITMRRLEIVDALVDATPRIEITERRLEIVVGVILEILVAPRGYGSKCG